jgi:ribosome biogenesis GTPase
LGADDGIGEAFSEIEALAKKCRFSDCTHTSEPGCAVQSALQSGDLDRTRYESYRALTKENRAAVRRQNAVNLRQKNRIRPEDRPRDKSYKRTDGM